MRRTRAALTLRERDHVDIAHPHTGLLDRLAHDTHHPLAVVPRRVGRQEPLAGRRNVRVSHIAEDSDEGCASLGGLVGDDAGAELVRAALDAERQQAVFCCQLTVDVVVIGEGDVDNGLDSGAGRAC